MLPNGYTKEFRDLMRKVGRIAHSITCLLRKRLRVRA